MIRMQATMIDHHLLQKDMDTMRSMNPCSWAKDHPSTLVSTNTRTDIARLSSLLFPLFLYSLLPSPFVIH